MEAIFDTSALSSCPIGGRTSLWGGGGGGGGGDS